MDLQKNKQNNDQATKKDSQKKLDAPHDMLLDYPEDMLIEEHSKDSDMKWEAPEYEIYEKSKNWYLGMTITLAVISIYALLKDSPIMAITFILIGVVGYLVLNKKPALVKFKINDDGIVANKQIFEFEVIESFWIFYDPPHEKILSLKTKGSFLPYSHIPIANEDPVKIRELLIKNIPEVEQEKSLVDIIERVFHL